MTDTLDFRDDEAALIRALEIWFRGPWQESRWIYGNCVDQLLDVYACNTGARLPYLDRAIPCMILAADRAGMRVRRNSTTIYDTTVTMPRPPLVGRA